MSAKNSLLIYVVEDNLIYNRLVCENLKKQDFTNIKSFTSGKDCIAAVKAGEKPDIVVQDYGLEDMTGIEVLVKVKKINKKTEFIFLTANENMDIAINTIKYGAYDYIIKDNNVAFSRLADKLNKVTKLIMLDRRNKLTRLAMIILLLVLSLIIISGMLLYVFGVIKTD